jgi:pyruvate-ferredoxin/flavodoxin oxidoreductase
MLAMSYGNVYVAHVAFGVKDLQTVKAFVEAEAFPGPSLIIAYSQCIAHGYDLAYGVEQQKLAVETGYWPLYRYDPRLADRGASPFQLDSQTPKGDLGVYMRNETRFRMVEQQDPERFARLLKEAKRNIDERFHLYESLARGSTPAKPLSTPPSG